MAIAVMPSGIEPWISHRTGAAIPMSRASGGYSDGAAVGAGDSHREDERRALKPDHDEPGEVAVGRRGLNDERQQHQHEDDAVAVLTPLGFAPGPPCPRSARSYHGARDDHERDREKPSL